MFCTSYFIYYYYKDIINFSLLDKQRIVKVLDEPNNQRMNEVEAGVHGSLNGVVKKRLYFTAIISDA